MALVTEFKDRTKRLSSRRLFLRREFGFLRESCVSSSNFVLYFSSVNAQSRLTIHCEFFLLVCSLVSTLSNAIFIYSFFRE